MRIGLRGRYFGEKHPKLTQTDRIAVILSEKWQNTRNIGNNASEVRICVKDRWISVIVAMESVCSMLSPEGYEVN
ncbi:hypothetical protein BSK56_15790 [Paenibacillus borealis]|uniref:Uncharacterized protein n=1 Tax=Paenibacillus borealis TaxID=160799 RepID=A0ABX3H867_PAEBO|nr:hypothetical protein BSK56_15790 [Paenibacillus borealis]